MADPVTLAVVAGTALTAGGTLLQASEARKGREAASAARDDAKRRQDDLLKKERQSQADLQAQQAGSARREAQRRLGDRGARRETLLTGPLGGVGQAAGGTQKTLLGA